MSDETKSILGHGGLIGGGFVIGAIVVAMMLYNLGQIKELKGQNLYCLHSAFFGSCIMGPGVNPPPAPAPMVKKHKKHAEASPLPGTKPWDTSLMPLPDTLVEPKEKK